MIIILATVIRSFFDKYFWASSGVIVIASQAEGKISIQNTSTKYNLNG